jgi:hypothetical protein
MTTQPRWEDSGQGDLLELVAMGSSTGTADHEWDLFESQLRCGAASRWSSGLIRPNHLRMHVRASSPQAHRRLHLPRRRSRPDRGHG